MKKLNVGRIGLLLLVSSLGLAACTPPPPEVVNTQIRFVNAATSAGVSADMDLIFEKIRKNTTPIGLRGVYPSADTYASVPSGGLTYSWCTAGTIDCSVKDLKVDTAKDKPKTVILMGTVETTDDNDATVANRRPLEAVVFNDDTPVPGDNQMKFRVIHAANTSLASDAKFHFTGPDDALQTVAPGIKYKEAYAYTEAPAKTYKLRVTISGTPDPILDSGAVSLVAGKTYTFVLTNPGLNKTGIILLTDK
jgi:hypothetical protein